MVHSGYARSLNAGTVKASESIFFLSRPLSQLLDDDEKEAVLAHEFAHAAAQHQRQASHNRKVSEAAITGNNYLLILEFFKSGLTNVAISTAVGLVSLLIQGDMGPKRNKGTSLMAPANFWRNNLPTLGAFATMSVLNPIFPGYVIATWTINKALQLISMQQSRNDELQADRVAVTNFEANPLCLITAFRKQSALIERSEINTFGQASNSIPKPRLTKIWSHLSRTHPDTDTRIKRLAKLAEESGAFTTTEIENAVHGEIDVSHATDLNLKIINLSETFYTNDNIPTEQEPHSGSQKGHSSQERKRNYG